MNSQFSTKEEETSTNQQVSLSNKIEARDVEVLNDKPKLDSWRNILVISILAFILIGGVGQNNEELAKTFFDILLLFWIVVFLYKINKKSFSNTQDEVTQKVSTTPEVTTSSSLQDGSLSRPRWVMILAVINFLLLVLYWKYAILVPLGILIGAILSTKIDSFREYAIVGAFFSSSVFFLSSLVTFGLAIEEKYRLGFLTKYKYQMFLPIIALLVTDILFYIGFLPPHILLMPFVDL
jgi:preprotein translocase subunit Sss1